MTSVETLRALPVGTVVKVPLGQIATVEQADAQGSITRIDGSPAASITADIADANTGAVSAGVQTEIDGLVAAGQIPSTVDVRLAGVTQQQNEAFGGLFTSMGVAILIVYLAMVLTFNSLVTPFIILFTLPLATIGAFPALLLTGRPIGISALIGFLMLIGIVVTNAIVLLDLVERLRREGMSTHDALIEGGRTRVRPILMTAIATILALVPLAAGFNQGSIIAAELGTVVIGGLLSSTFLTLLVIPVVYSLVDGLRRRVCRSPSVATSRVAEPAARPDGRPRRRRDRGAGVRLAAAGMRPSGAAWVWCPWHPRSRTGGDRMAITRYADVNWSGGLTDGAGTINYVSSGAFSRLPVTWGSRTEDHNGRTSPEELIAAAHASCFSMAFSARLAKNGTPPTSLDVRATITFDNSGGGWKIQRSDITVRGAVPGIDAAKFAELAEDAKENCPVSVALKGNVELAVDAQLA